MTTTPPENDSSHRGDRPALMLDEMVAFWHVVEHGGFSQAARALGVEPSSMSRSVARLERALQAKLLIRGPRSMALTELGEQVLRECALIRDAAGNVHALAARYGARPSGVLRVSAPVVLGQLWLAPRLASFAAAYPDVDLQLSLNDRPIDIVTERVDVALRITTKPPQDLVARKLFDTPYVLVASPAYLAAHGAPERPEMLTRHRCIHLGFGAFDANWPLRRGDEQMTVAIAPRQAIGNSLALASAAEQGAGIALLPLFSAQAGLDAGRLVRVLEAWTPAGTYERAAYLLYAAGARVPPKVKAFVEHMSATP
ncbi:LysR family transcriptional regulator [Roseateles chitinivorans]|uniref:LysR family transcriptional regulator n=1 Tax=Roseateles chitinivorans TaxID=2917965 RepID=UPI003D66D41B